jgi:hypothetical protein
MKLFMIKDRGTGEYFTTDLDWSVHKRDAMVFTCLPSVRSAGSPMLKSMPSRDLIIENGAGKVMPW